MLLKCHCVAASLQLVCKNDDLKTLLYGIKLVCMQMLEAVQCVYTCNAVGDGCNCPYTTVSVPGRS